MSSLVDRMLDPPEYGYEREGRLYMPSRREILREFFNRLSPFKSRNWLAIASVGINLLFAIAFIVFVACYFSWPLLFLGLSYALFIMGSHANFWVHRYCTHRAFRFRTPVFRFVCANLVIKAYFEEVHVISHHVHHQLSDKPGDPYNAGGGWLYCFLSDVNHQGVRKDLTIAEYDRVSRLLSDTNIFTHRYSQYLRWGSICRPGASICQLFLNWFIWFGLFYFVGGPALATAMFGAAGIWALGYRNFNYVSHGGGSRPRRTDDGDISGDISGDTSVNRFWSGITSGEWHRNHHLFPGSARSGFLPYQLDMPWLAIRVLNSVGIISSYRDNTSLFLKRYQSDGKPSNS